MNEASTQNGVLAVVLDRFEKFKLPRALDIKTKVDQGETLEDSDLKFLEGVMRDAAEIRRFVDERPDLQPLYARATALYSEIIAKALENEQKS